MQRQVATLHSALRVGSPPDEAVTHISGDVVWQWVDVGWKHDLRFTHTALSVVASI